MVTKLAIDQYKGTALLRGEGFVYIPPHPALRPYISNYTFTFPEETTMSDQYTIMPSASSTLVFSSTENRMQSDIRGVNTKACMVGQHANQCSFLLLIEFHPGGFYSFLQLHQLEFQDVAINFGDISADLDRKIKDALEHFHSIDLIVQFLNHTFLSYYQSIKDGDVLFGAMNLIIKNAGRISVKDLANDTHYSEKHLNRFFQQYVGTSIKTFSRIVRINHILRLMDSMDGTMAQLAQIGNYFDQSHFIHDFKSICGVTPQEYIHNKSIFYNELFKL